MRYDLECVGGVQRGALEHLCNPGSRSDEWEENRQVWAAVQESCSFLCSVPAIQTSGLIAAGMPP